MLLTQLPTDNPSNDKAALLAFYREVLNKIHFEAGNVFYNKPSMAVYATVAKLASDLRRQP